MVSEFVYKRTYIFIISSVVLFVATLIGIFRLNVLSHGDIFNSLIVESSVSYDISDLYRYTLDRYEVIEVEMSLDHRNYNVLINS